MTDTQTWQPNVSVIVGFKDWGLERLELSIQTIHQSLLEFDHEVIISDYGSSNTDAIADLANRVDARHEKVRTDGEWSRSRALNAGVSVSRGEYILATDADMLFSPGALDRVVQQLERHPHEIVILQCRDLPTGFSHEVVSDQGLDWERFASIAQIRPRWGMGGLVGVHKDVWRRLRGWDERMHTYGGEDIDFAKRAQMYGARIDWLDEPGVAMYHVWHPSSSVNAFRSKESSKAIEHNRAIHTHDKTFARNRLKYRYLPRDLPPIVSIYLDGTHEDPGVDRTLASVSGQTIRDIEILVKDENLLKEWDARIKLATVDEPEPEGTFIAVAQAGEIWGDEFLETLLDNWSPGVGIISATSAHALSDEGRGKLSDPTPLESGVPNVRASMVRRSLLQDFGPMSAAAWLESVRTTAASGVTWMVRPEVQHVQISTIESEESFLNTHAESCSVLESTMARCGVSLPELPEAVDKGLGVHAEALLHGHVLTVTGEAAGSLATSLRAPQVSDGFLTERTLQTRAGSVLRASYTWSGSSVNDAQRAAFAFEQAGADVRFGNGELEFDDAPTEHDQAIWLARSCETSYGVPDAGSVWLLIRTGNEALESVLEPLTHTPSITAVLDRTVSENGIKESWVAARLRGRDLAEAHPLAAENVGHGATFIVELPPLASNRKDYQ